MIYEYTREHGLHLAVENEGEQTTLHLGSSGPGQQQSQSTGFHTGRWTGEPQLFQAGSSYVLRIETAAGAQALRISGHRIEHLREAPDLAGAESLPLHKSEGGRTGSMKPMEPMRPMAPMRPMEPMKPMEMRMGNMEMRMGGGGGEQGRFCTKCGQSVRSGDLYCGACGSKL